MVGQQGIVKAVIETPLSEYQDVHHIDTRNLYKNVVLPIVGNTYIKVCLKYIKVYGRERAIVRTAYATNGLKKGEVWLWGHKLEK